jgi:hypothetical protein
MPQAFDMGVNKQAGDSAFIDLENRLEDPYLGNLNSFCQLEPIRRSINACGHQRGSAWTFVSVLSTPLANQNIAKAT